MVEVFGIQAVTGRNGVRKVLINVFTAIGIAALLAVSVGLLQLDIETMSAAKRKSLPILNLAAIMTGLSFVAGAAKIAAGIEKED